MGLYAIKNADGAIVALSREPREGFTALDEEDPALTAFRAEALGLENQLAQSDLDFVRVIEDVIGLLTDQGLLRYTDLPEAAQRKLNLRQRLRERHRGLDLLGDQDDLML